MKRRYVALALALVLALGLAGCGAKNSSGSYASTTTSTGSGYARGESVTADSAYWGGVQNAPDPSPAEPNYAGKSNTQSTLPEGVKMIYTANLEMQSTEFDRAVDDIAKLVAQLGGYFEQRSVQDYSSGYRYANYTVRVPSAQFQPFLNQVGTLCHVLSATDNAQDITESYYDTDSRLKTAQTKLARLQELLAKADNMSDIITIESAISDTEYQIENLSGTLRHYDALVDYSTIYLSLREVVKLTDTEQPPETFGERFARSFRDGLEDFGEAMEDFAVWLAYHWLGLLVFLAVAFLVIRAIIALARRGQTPRPPRKTRRQKKAEAAAAAAEAQKETDQP